MKILLCDDERDITEGLALLLACDDVTTVETHSANEAIKALERESFDIIICDFFMPQGNGDLVMNYVINHHLPTKFVFFSSHIERYQITNKDVFIVPKPDFEVLIEMVNAMIPVSLGKV